LAVQQIAYIQGLLEEDTELRRLARGYLYNDLPHPAALVLAKEMEAGTIESDGAAFELLANSWIAAREYDESLGPLQKAADLSENGNLYVRLGQVHMHREEWSDAVRLFQKAVARGDLKEPGNAHLLLGISHYNAESVARARASFARARKYEPSRRQADLWIDHIEREARQAG
jgi:tetratricopeptide (TPR) repeat protein